MLIIIAKIAKIGNRIGYSIILLKIIGTVIINGEANNNKAKIS